MKKQRWLTSIVSLLQLDDWVLCRIYRKSHVSSPTSNSAASDDLEEEFLQEPILKSPPNHNTLRSQKSSSFSNLLDAMDYSMLSNFLSETQTGIESNPLFTSGILEQPVFNNGINSGGNTNGYIIQKLPPLNSSPPNLENKLKRAHSNMDDNLLHPSKKFINSCSFQLFTTTGSHVVLIFFSFSI